MKRFLGSVVAALYVGACFLPGEPSGGERIEFQLDFALPYRVPLAGTAEPAIRITAGGQALSNAHYRLESLDEGVVRVDPTGRGLEGAVRGTGSVRVVYQTGTGASDTVFPVQVVVSRIAVGPSLTSLTRLGATIPLGATAYDAKDAAVPNVAFTWSSADPQVATVNDTGLVRAVDEGTVAITAEADSVKGLASITVTQVAAQVRLAPELDTLRTVGRTAQFIAVALDEAGRVLQGARPRWTSSDPMVATVDGAGRATATGAGSAQIIARVGEAADSATLVVAQVVRFLVVTPGYDTLTAIADTARLVALAFDSLNFPIPNPTAGWATSDAAVATVDQAGLVRAANNGVVLVTGSAVGQSASATVLVRQEVVAARIAPDNVVLTGQGATAQLSATGLDRNDFVVDGAVVTWRSRNPFVATVDAAGLVTAWGDGWAEITASPVNGGQSDTVAVTVTGALQLAVIAFESPRGIEVVGADGSGRRLLVSDAAQPAWSPDGGRLAFTRACAIHTVSSDGSGERRVSAATDGAKCENQPAWSPDAAKIAFWEYQEVQTPPYSIQSIYIVNADGSNRRILLDGSSCCDFYSPTWSPDGTKIAYSFYDYASVDNKLGVVNADGSGGFRLLSDIGWEPAWSPDGSEIAFQHFETTLQGNAIWLMNADGSAARGLGVGGESPAWSPDGSRLVFHRHDGSQWDLYVINRDGTGLRRLTSTPEYEYSPTWR